MYLVQDVETLLLRVVFLGQMSDVRAESLVLGAERAHRVVLLLQALSHVGARLEADARAELRVERALQPRRRAAPHRLLLRLCEQ